MRTAMTALAILTASLVTVPAVHAEDTLQTADAAQMAKVYRDYPGYMAPVQCESTMAAKTPPANEGTAATSYGSACEERGDRHYISAWAGGTATRDADPGSNIEISFDNGFGGGLAVGYDFGAARLEIEGSFRKSDIDKIRTAAGTVKADDDLELFTVLINGYVDFATHSPATPYLGVGAGCARAEVGNRNDDFVAGQLAAGVLLEVAPAVSVDLGYRYLLPIDKDDLDIHQHTAFVGLQFRF